MRAYAPVDVMYSTVWKSISTGCILGKDNVHSSGLADSSHLDLRSMYWEPIAPSRTAPERCSYPRCVAFEWSKCPAKCSRFPVHPEYADCQTPPQTHLRQTLRRMVSFGSVLVRSTHTSKGRGPLGVALRHCESQGSAGCEQQSVSHGFESWIWVPDSLGVLVSLNGVVPKQLI